MRAGLRLCMLCGDRGRVAQVVLDTAVARSAVALTATQSFGLPHPQALKEVGILRPCRADELEPWST